MQTQTSSALYNDTVSSCSTSNVQEKTQLSRSRCMHSLREVKSQFKFLSETLQDFGTMSIFRITFSQDLDLLEQHLTKDILSHTDYKTTLKNLITKFENAFNSEFKERMHKYTRFDAQSFKDAMICTMNSIGKYMLEILLHQQRNPHLLKQKKLMQTQEDHSNPIKALNVDSLKVDSVVIQNHCSETEDSNSETTSSKSVKESSLDSATKDGVNNQFQKFIDSQVTLDYDSQRTHKYFVEYTRNEVKHFRDTLLQHMGNVKKSVFERARHQRQYDRRVNKRLMQTQKSKIDTGKAVNDDLVVTKSSGIESEVQDDNNRSGNDTDADDADVRPIYNEEPMAKTVAQFQKDFSRMEAHCIALELKYQNQALKSRQHGQVLNDESNKSKIKKEIGVLETINIELEHKVANFRKENETLKKHYKDLYDSTKITKYKNIEQTTSLLANNAALKAQIQEKVFATAALKNDLRKLKGNSVDTKFANTSVLGKPEVNLCEKIQSHKTRDRNKPVDQKRQIITGHTFSPNKTSNVYEKISPRSDLRWKPMGRIFKSVGLRWLPTGKLFDSCISKVESEPPHGSNIDISKIHEFKQTLDLSAGTSINVSKKQSLDLSAGIIWNVNKENLRPRNTMSTEVPSTDTIVMTSMIELESLFDPSFVEYFDGENRVVSKPFAVTTADTSDKRQHQPDSTSSTSSLATTVSADGNFIL
nr:hypothetical protein [Tanacetum cinerariifolium]